MAMHGDGQLTSKHLQLAERDQSTICRDSKRVIEQSPGVSDGLQAYPEWSTRVESHPGGSAHLSGHTLTVCPLFSLFASSPPLQDPR